MPRFRSKVLVLMTLCASLSGLPSLPAEEPAKPLTFEKDILPIFRAKCVRCHAGVEPKAGLNLTRPSSLLSGGKSGPSLRIRAAEFSLLYEMVSSGKMPPEGQRLTAEEKGRIRQWINDGAEGVSNAQTVDLSDEEEPVEHWAFKPPQRPEVPTPEQMERVANPIDAFVLRRLEESGLTLARDADRATLLRRVAFDLRGVPPSPDEFAAFLADTRPDAYSRIVERMLASPQYGERWGRHWLDVAGYAESAGILSEDRPLPLAWRYRDYVIRAFNKDKPYDRFLQEQLAGDELMDYWTAFETKDRLPDDVVEGITATGFLRTAADASRPDFNTIKNADSQYFYPTLFDTLQIVCSSTMGLTVQCARCHSHKFDPIPQADYYRMQSVFMTAYRPDNWVPQMNRRLHIASKKEKDAAAKKNAEVDANVKKLNAELAAQKKQAVERILMARFAALPEAIREDVRTSLQVKAESRTAVQKYLAMKFAALALEGKALDAKVNEDEAYKKKAEELNAKVAAEQKRRWLFDEVRALYDLPGEATTPLLLRGDPLTPGPPVQPGVLSALDTPQGFHWSPPPAEAKTSGRRLAFARWLTQPAHPLTPRVMVNRIWMHHFGTGLVATPEDFGVLGSPPSHPELLDWLAVEFVESGWSVKHIHRLILASSTWRQASRLNAAEQESGERTDPGNQLLWRQNMRRLEGESLRDAVLSVSGTLKHQMYGSSRRVARQKDGEVIVPVDQDPQRRSVYVQILRLNPESMLEAFDQPTMSINCTQRSTSTVATQALTMLNSDMMQRAAAAFAVRLADSTNPVDDALRAAYCRPATASERDSLSRFHVEQTQRYLASRPEAERAMATVVEEAKQKALTDVCHMLLSANEFAYID